jgi:hypothetical protein
MLFAALAGMVWMGVRHPGPALVLGAFPVAYYVAAGSGYNVFVRYMIPVVPFLCLFAAYFVGAAANALGGIARLRPALVAAVSGLAIAALPAWHAVQFDRLLTREDSRITAGRWLMENVPAGASMFISGNRYGHPAMDFIRYRQFGYNYRGNVFTVDQQPTGELPQWLVIQRAEIPYSHVPERVEAQIAREYQLVHIVRAYAPDARNFYDVQDGFYLPFGSFEGVERPGPNVLIYRRQ